MPKWVRNCDTKVWGIHSKVSIALHLQTFSIPLQLCCAIFPLTHSISPQNMSCVTQCEQSVMSSPELERWWHTAETVILCQITEQSRARVSQWTSEKYPLLKFCPDQAQNLSIVQCTDWDNARHRGLGGRGRGTGASPALDKVGGVLLLHQSGDRHQDCWSCLPHHISG